MNSNAPSLRTGSASKITGSSSKSFITRSWSIGLPGLLKGSRRDSVVKVVIVKGLQPPIHQGDVLLTLRRAI